MKTLYKLLTTGALIIATTACQTTSSSDQAAALGYIQGDVVQSLANIHPDSKGNRIDSLNYQLPIVVPVCSEFTIDAIGSRNIKLSSNGVQYNYILNKHTSNAGQSLPDGFKTLFGDKCDSKKINKLSKVDKQGIKQGTAIIGMSKEGVLLAMGRPPIHANPTTDSNTWIYWRNRWGKRAIEFSEKGKVTNIR